MRKHVMAARLMKYINDVNMATGEVVEIMPDGIIHRDSLPSDISDEDPCDISDEELGNIADEALGNISQERKDMEIKLSWATLRPNVDVNNISGIIMPDGILDLVSRFQKEAGACQTACLVARKAISDGYQPTKAGILDWIRDNDMWFADHNISVWRRRAIEWLTKPTETEAISEPCEWPEYSKTYKYAYKPLDKNGVAHEVTVFLNGAKSSMIKITDADGRNPQYFQGCDGLGYFSNASDYISAWERGDIRGI